MTFARPTLAQLIERARADLESVLPGTDARLRYSIEDALARVLAGQAHGLFGHQVWLSKQIFPDTAELAFLNRWASFWGVERKAAAKATGTVTFSGTDGNTIPAGTAVQKADGTSYTTDALGTIAGGTADVAITAAETGLEGNAAAGSTVSLVTPIAGVDSDATVDASGLAGGLDEEDDDDLRDRLLARIQTPPQAGGPGDYVNWAKEVAGVTRAWEFKSWQGAGTVGVVFVTDDEVSIIPTAPKVAEVQAYLGARAPVAVDVYAVAPTTSPLTVTLTYLDPNTAAVQAAVQSSLESKILREASPGGSILISKVREAVSIATGEDDYIMSAPVGNLSYSAGVLPILGTVTFP